VLTGNDAKATVILSCIPDTLRSLLIPEEEEDEENLDIREYVDQVEPRLIGVERGEGDGGF
jgi:hypothetical protein